jgi:uncharacterized protein YcfL
MKNLMFAFVATLVMVSCSGNGEGTANESVDSTAVATPSACADTCAMYLDTTVIPETSVVATESVVK